MTEENKQPNTHIDLSGLPMLSKLPDYDFAPVYEGPTSSNSDNTSSFIDPVSGILWVPFSQDKTLYVSKDGKKIARIIDEVITEIQTPEDTEWFTVDYTDNKITAGKEGSPTVWQTTDFVVWTEMPIYKGPTLSVSSVDWLGMMHDTDREHDFLITELREMYEMAVETFADKRKDFESFYKRLYTHADMTLSKGGGYIDAHVEAAWSIFKHGIVRATVEQRRHYVKTNREMKVAIFTKFARRFRADGGTAVTKPERVRIKRDGPFFIGGYLASADPKKVHISHYPKFHKTLEVAEAEAQRLANINDGVYWVYGSTGSRFVKDPNAQVDYVVSGYSDRIAEHSCLDEYIWEKSDKPKCLPTYVCARFNSKMRATELYKLMGDLEMPRYKNWV